MRCRFLLLNALTSSSNQNLTFFAADNPKQQFHIFFLNIIRRSNSHFTAKPDQPTEKGRTDGNLYLDSKVFLACNRGLNFVPKRSMMDFIKLFSHFRVTVRVSSSYIENTDFAYSSTEASNSDSLITR